MLPLQESRYAACETRADGGVGGTQHAHKNQQQTSEATKLASTVQRKPFSKLEAIGVVESLFDLVRLPSKGGIHAHLKSHLRERNARTNPKISVAALSSQF